jgi:peptide/nickel transport system permease protein
VTPAGPLALVARRFLATPRAVAALSILATLATGAALAPMAASLLEIDPERVDLMLRFAPPSPAHPLGTDELGRDVLVRLLYGGRISLAVGFAGALACGVVGTVVGLAAGYAGGRLDAVLMRLTDAVIALPVLPLLIVLAAVDPAKIGLSAGSAGADWAGVLRVVVIVALVGWTTVARLVRGSALALRERAFVLSARAQGAGSWRIMTVHILPNLASPLIVATALAAGNTVLLESVLSFLGLGIHPPTPSWGNMLTGAQDLIWSSPALALYPGVLIVLTVVALNLAGDELRDALDPRTRHR